ncbi:MAG: hypothetical protein U1F10_14185 [Burkholderiales bacterium]
MIAAQDVTVTEVVTWLFLVTNTGRVLAYLPQIRSAWRCENGAASVSRTTWGLFAVAHFSGALYASLVVADLRMALVFVGNFAACTVLVSVIAWKRHAYAVAMQGKGRATADWPRNARQSVLIDEAGGGRGHPDAHDRGRPTRETQMGEVQVRRDTGHGWLDAGWRRQVLAGAIAVGLLTAFVTVRGTTHREEPVPVRESLVTQCDRAGVAAAEALATATPESSEPSLRRERERGFNACVDRMWIDMR